MVSRVWSIDIIIDELNTIIRNIGHFPTQKELISMDRYDLLRAIQRRGGINKFRQLLGYDIIQKPPGYWNDEVIINELKLILEKLGHFPTVNELVLMDRRDLTMAISKHGGINKFRNLFGFIPIQKPEGFWTRETLIKEINMIIEKIGHFPTQSELILMDRQDILGILPKYGGLNNIRISMGYNTVFKPVGYWNDETIVRELMLIIEQIGHFPTHNELISMGRAGLSGVIVDNGGYGKFKKLMGYDKPIERPKKWTDEKIITELKPIIEKLGYFPSPDELNDIGRVDLRGAIRDNGGFIRFRELMGYPISLQDKYRSLLASYINKRGKKSEKFVEQILIEYCHIHDISLPRCNSKLSKGNVIEFVCNTNKKIGIDVTNVKGNGRSVSAKWRKKDYHKHLDELWIVVFSDKFTKEDYKNWNDNSPKNVKVMSIYEFLKELDYSLDEHTKKKIDKYCSCTFHTKEDLKPKKNTTLKRMVVVT